MPDRLKIFKLLLPAEFVVFDHNPERMQVSKRQSGGGVSQPSGIAGTLGAMFHGTDPLELRITKAHLVGPECKPMCDTLLSWLSPGSGLLGAAAAAIGNAIPLEAAKTPQLVVQWGVPGVGIVITALMTKVSIKYIRISRLGIPIHALVDLTLKETPSPLSLTNPTSGGRPGRNRHVVTADETLMSIATNSFGSPGAWRAIAEVNNIDDPTSIQPGDTIYLPARAELRELAEAAR